MFYDRNTTHSTVRSSSRAYHHLHEWSSFSIVISCVSGVLTHKQNNCRRFISKFNKHTEYKYNPLFTTDSWSWTYNFVAVASNLYDEKKVSGVSMLQTSCRSPITWQYNVKYYVIYISCIMQGALEISLPAPRR